MPVARKSPSGPAAILAVLGTTVDFTNINAEVVSTTTITVTGAAVGDLALVSPREAGDDKVILKPARVSAANVVLLAALNTGTTSIDSTSLTLDVYVLKQGET